MANTYVDYTATAGQTDFAFSFPYLEDSHVVVEVEGVNQALTTNYTIETSPAQKVVLSNPTTAIAGGELVRVKRVSDPSTNLVDFVNGSVLTETELDRAYLHNRYLAEEAIDGVNAGLGEVEGSTNYNANNKQIKNLADGTLATDAVNKGYVDTQIALTDTNLAGFFKSTHTGNAVDNVFTLSFTPQTTEAEAYIVSIDGLVQVPDTDYTIGATDITFNTIPANSAEICVVATAASSVATVNEAQVTATGSTTARSLADRFTDVINVKDYGAKGNGSHNDTDAIQDAIDAATLNTSSAIVYFPPHDISQYYRITAPLVCNKPVTLLGAGMQGVTIWGEGLTSGQYILDLDNEEETNNFFTVERLTLRSDNGAPNGMRIRNCSFSVFKDLNLQDLTNGIVITGKITPVVIQRAFSNTFERVHGESIIATTVRFENFSGGGQYKFDGCTFNGSTGFSVAETARTDGLSFVNCNFEQCGINSVYIGGYVDGLSFFGCRTEGGTGKTADFNINPEPGNHVFGLTISGCFFSSGTGGSYPILIGGAGGTVRGFSITGNSGGYIGNPYFVYFNGTGDSGLIAGNFTRWSSSIVNVARFGVVIFGNEYDQRIDPSAVPPITFAKNDEYWNTVPWAVENGNWTPIDASTANLSFSSSDGTYQRIGNTVFFHAAVNYGTTSDTSLASIGGLPFNIYPGGAALAGRSGANLNLTNSPATGLLLREGTTTFDIYSSGFTRATNANLSATSLYMSGMYRIQ